MNKSKGFTLIELLVVITVFGLLAGYSTVAYLNVQKNSDLAGQTSQLISSIRQAQFLAISGQTQDQENRLEVGLHFEANKYTIFFGSNYNVTAPTNIETVLPENIIININLGGSNLLFSKGNGEVKDYDPDHHSLTLVQSEGQSRTLDINKIGVVDIE